MAKTKTQKRRRVSKASRRKTVPKTRKLKKKGGGNDLLENWARLQVQKKTVGAPCFFCGDKGKKGWFGLPERWEWPWNNKPKPTTLTNGDGNTGR